MDNLLRLHEDMGGGEGSRSVHLSYFNKSMSMSTKLYNKWFHKAGKASKNVQAFVSLIY